jgi:hypothetical protein
MVNPENEASHIYYHHRKVKDNLGGSFAHRDRLQG